MIPRGWRIVRRGSLSPKGARRYQFVWCVELDTGELHFLCIEVG